MAMTAICLPNFLIARKFQLLLPQANMQNPNYDLKNAIQMILIHNMITKS